jgi:hypothetical protein
MNHMNFLVVSASIAVSALLPAAAFGTEPVAAIDAAPTYSTEFTDIGTLLDNAATRAVLEKHLPDFVGNPQIEMARAMTLRQIQSFAPDIITDEVLANIDADLAAIPAAE